MALQILAESDQTFTRDDETAQPIRLVLAVPKLHIWAFWGTFKEQSARLNFSETKPLLRLGI